MRALKIVAALLMIALLIMTTPLMLVDVLNPFCAHKGASFGLWAAIAASAWGLVHLSLRAFQPRGA